MSTATLEASGPFSDKATTAPGWRRRAIYAAIGLVWIAAAIAGGLTGLFQAFGPPPLGRDLNVSTLVLDRNGKLLRAYLTSEGRWRLPATKGQVDPRYLDALLAYEDKRFYHHRGIDPLAMARAALQLVTHGRIVSGGSTITMQVARLLEPRTERSLDAKLRQAVRAAPCRNKRATPQSPEFRRPDRSPEGAKRARDRVLDRIASHGLFSEAEISRAKEEPVPDARKPMPLLAPHAADQAAMGSPNDRVLQLTIDAGLQRTLESLAHDRAMALGPAMSVAIVVVDNATGEVLARVASPDYFDERRAGQVDLTEAVRSPGSALKPFIYGLGFEDGLIHPETLIEDRPIRYGGYHPENFDMTFQGTVTVRRALQQSLNVPAVAVLNEVGPSRLIARLSEADAAEAERKARRCFALGQDKRSAGF